MKTLLKHFLGFLALLDSPTRRMVGIIQFYIEQNIDLRKVVEFGGNASFIKYDTRQNVTITDQLLQVDSPTHTYATYDFNRPIPDTLKNSFDLAVSINSLYYATDIVFSIDQFILSLKPGGKLFLCLPFNYPWTDKHLPQYRISPLTVRQILNRAGGYTKFYFIGSRFGLISIYLHRFFYVLAGKSLNLKGINSPSNIQNFTLENDVKNFEDCLWYVVEFTLQSSKLQ